MIGHPSKQALTAYAEGLVDARTAFHGPVARHIHACRRCAAETAAIRHSLRTLAAAPDLAPSPGSAEEILLAARQVRGALASGRGTARTGALGGAVKGLSYAAALVAIAGASFWSALAGQPGAVEDARPASLAAASDAAATDAAERTAAQVQTLAAALTGRQEVLASHPDQARLRAVLRLDADIREAMAALETNPASEQARHLVDVNRRRQAETLRRLYAERSL